MEQLHWRILGRLVLPFVDRPLSKPTTRETELCEELRDKFRQHPPVDTRGLLPSEAAWMGYMNSLRELVLVHDPREFLRWAPVGMMMFPTQVSMFTEELRFLKRLPDWTTRWRDAIRESPAGHPLPFLLHPRSSGNLIRHAYHVAQFEAHTGEIVHDLDFVFDFGGGYGSMCRMFRNLGFRGQYVIFDLPLFTYLQAFYLKSIGIEVGPVETSARKTPIATCTSNFEHLKTILAGRPRQARTAFIANESISEIPVDQREKFLQLVLDFDSFLVSYSNKYREADNTDYFKKWKENFGHSVEWHDWQIKQMPGFSYLMGKRIAQ